MNPGPAGASPARLVAAGEGQWRLEGELCLAQVGPLRDAGRAAFAAAGERALGVDLAGVARADSAGLALLIDWLAWARGAGRTLAYAHVPAGLLALARLSELDSLLVP